MKEKEPFILFENHKYSYNVDLEINRDYKTPYIGLE